MIPELQELAQSVRQAGPFAFCGIGVRTGGQDHFHGSCMNGLAADARAFWRAASMSKVLTGRCAWAVCKAYDVPATTPIEDLLGFRLHCDGYPPPSIAQVAHHSSGLTDAGGYSVPLDMTLRQWLDQTGDHIWSGAGPGLQFEYSNLGFVILAACTEKISGLSFDEAVQIYVSGPNRIEAYFNWSRAPQGLVRIPTYRLDLSGFVPQIDDAASETVVAASEGYGDYVQTLSPQGGARLSLQSALNLAETLKDHPRDFGWKRDASKTKGPTDLFHDYAWGAQIYETPSFYPRPLIGHFANAYGMCGGVWHDPERDVQFAYVLNGLPVGDEADDLRPEERQTFRAISYAA